MTASPFRVAYPAHWFPQGLKLPSALPSEDVAGAQANGSAGQMPAAQGDLHAAPHIEQADRTPVPDGTSDAPGKAAGGLGGAAWLLGAGLHSSAGRLGSGLHSMVADGALPLGRAAFDRVQATLGRGELMSAIIHAKVAWQLVGAHHRRQECRPECVDAALSSLQIPSLRASCSFVMFVQHAVLPLKLQVSLARAVHPAACPLR